MSHFIMYCKYCEKVISQCRCPSKDKEKKYGVCTKCAESKSGKRRLDESLSKRVLTGEVAEIDMSKIRVSESGNPT